MPELDPNTLVLVGIGVVSQRQQDPADAREAITLMIEAVTQAGADAGIEAELRHLDSVLVPQGLWSYADPGRMIADADADAVDARNARTVYGKIGVMQQTLLNEACLGIARGEHQMAVVAGGEAKYRDLRAFLGGIEVSETANDAVPDVTMEPDAKLYHDLEVAALGHTPVGYYAIIENSFRAARAWSVEEHRDRLAQLYSRFSEIAAQNPHAWKRQYIAPEAIRNASSDNNMLAFPLYQIAQHFVEC